jgi:hypothetical protein
LIGRVEVMQLLLAAVGGAIVTVALGVALTAESE